MRINIGDIVASCSSCQSSDFIVAEADPGTKTPTLFKCEGCGSLVGYRALLEQLTKEAIGKTAELLSSLKKKS